MTVRESEAAQQSGGTNVHGDEAHRPFNEVKEHIVRAHHLATINVHDLLIKEIGLQQDLILALGESRDINVLRAEPYSGRIESLHGAPREVDAAAAGAHHKARDGWVARANGNDQIVDRTDCICATVAHGTSNESREMEHRALRCWARRSRQVRLQSTRGSPRRATLALNGGAYE